MHILGIDIGGSGIKGAPVDTERGELIADRYRLDTPPGAKPKDVAKVVGKIVNHYDWKGPVGCGFPAPIRRGVALYAANVHKTWINTDVALLFNQTTGCTVTVVNDADAAGHAEMIFGAGQERDGSILLLTLGTGIGSALFVDGELVPNTEFGHVLLKDGIDAEVYTSAAARKRDDLSYKKWAKRLTVYLRHMELLVRPELFILGGGVSKKHEKFVPYLDIDTEVIPAEFYNEAGIVGAALAARP